MSEISSIASDGSFYEVDQEPKVLDWKKTGSVALGSFSFLSLCIGATAPFKKKRTVLPVPAANGANIEVPVGVPYDELVCTPIDQEKIRYIITTVAEGGLNLAYPWIIVKLKQFGDDIWHVHPFKFITSAPFVDLKSIMTGGNPLKINNVMGGIERGMEREREKNNLERYIPDFAAEMRTTPQAIQPLIQVRDWRGLVDHLISLRRA